MQTLREVLALTDSYQRELPAPSLPLTMPVGAEIAFLLGALLPEDKVYETCRVIENDAYEVDMVINMGALKGEAYGLVLNDILFVTQAAHARGARVKVIAAGANRIGLSAGVSFLNESLRAAQ